MKRLLFVLLLTIASNTYAFTVEGFNELGQAIANGTPDTVEGKIFNLKVKGNEDYNLDLEPAQPFKIEKTGRNTFRVIIIDRFALYNNLGNDETPFYVPQYREIKNIVSVVASGTWDGQVGGSFRCILAVSFSFNGQTIDFNNRSKFIYNFDYDHSKLEFLGTEGKLAKFKRKSDGYAEVSLTLETNRNNQSINIGKQVVGYCERDRERNNSHPIREWSRWSSWSECSKTCNSGIQRRERYCAQKDHSCEGESTQIRSCNEQACVQRSTSLTSSQIQTMRFHSVTVKINDTIRTFMSRKFTAEYTASIVNPFSRTIRCNIELTSTRGIGEDYEVIDKKAHVGITIAPMGISYAKGSIKCKKGRGEDGLDWISNNGHSVKASGCVFID